MTGGIWAERPWMDGRIVFFIDGSYGFFSTEALGFGLGRW